MHEEPREVKSEPTESEPAQSRQYLKPPEYFNSWDPRTISPEENQRRYRIADEAIAYCDGVARNFVDEYYEKLGSYRKIPGTLENIIQFPEKRNTIFPEWTDNELDNLWDEVLRLSSDRGDSAGENLNGEIEIPEVIPVAEKYATILKSLRERWQENQAVTYDSINDLVIMARGGNPSGIRTKYFSNWENRHFKDLVHDITGKSIDDF